MRDTKPKPQIPANAHRAVLMADRFLDRAYDLYAEVVAVSRRAGDPPILPALAVLLLRRACRYVELSVVLMDRADALADAAGVPPEGRSTPRPEQPRYHA